MQKRFEHFQHQQCDGTGSKSQCQIVGMEWTEGEEMAGKRP